MVEYIVNEYTRIFAEELDKGIRYIISAKTPTSDVKVYATRQGTFYSVSVYVIRDLMYAKHPGHTALVRTYIEQHYWGKPGEHRFNKLKDVIGLLMRDKEEQLHHNEVMKHFL